MFSMASVDEDDKLDRDAAVNVLRRAGRLLRPYRRQCRTAVVLVVLSTSATLAGPLLVRYGIDHGIKTGNVRNLNAAVVLYAVITVVTLVISSFQVLLFGKVGEGFLRDMRVRVFDHIQDMSMPFYDREKAGVVVSRMTSDVDSLQELVQMGLLQFVQSILLIAITVVVLALVSWQLLLVSLIPVPFVVLASRKFQRDSNVAYLTVRDRIGSVLARLQEGIGGVRVIQAYGREQVESDRFVDTNQDLYRAHMRSVFVQAWYLPVIEFAGLGTTALAVGLGGWMVTTGVVTVGTVAFFVLSLSNLFEPIQQLSQLFNQVQSAGAALHKLFELLDTPIDVPEAPDAVDLPRRPEIAVQDVSFAYAAGAAPVLRDVDLTIDPGERLALVGPTGAGKSTLAKLIARMYDVTDGTISFGGVDVRRASRAALRRCITVVPQEGFLFGGTIRENVRIAKAGATDDEVDAALEAIGVKERFEALSEGLDTEVRERGSRLSAGEKQLVSLARAALADPDVLVLDEATSSLDPGTEALVERAMDHLMQGRTTIVIAHRLSTAERADRVGLVADGELAELGTHDELVARGGHYTKLYDAWTAGLAQAG